MTDEGLSELEATCRVEADSDGRVTLRAADVLDVVAELRELRKHAADLNAHEGTIAHLHRLLTHMGSYADSPARGALTDDGHVAIQDPGR